ncbi:MAG TPA: flagellar basal-body rod protein FlgG [Aquifex aeolicus]|uniref:Flagellar basal-body rod protein FlgG n=1 Tax=Aquifex aeolicus TaxID=63363 RepID=A0A9D1CFC0_AQUAO|nr:flagellar basal-body rod protein FlgG [Aquificales bacterium]HIP97987.1 flagellar basal-body rod protein FlgG [Aquifex aeolicus]HIQ26454.1 flagellar basal-body rod protein FlgG [Aquifex aeolicus]
MLRALWTAATGMTAQQENIDIISNNIANVNTTGYKKMRPAFQDLVYQTVEQPGVPTSDTTQNPSGKQVGLGTRIAGTYGIFSQGNLIKTDRQLDIAIDGDGFFKILLPDGTEAYTRDGNFKLDKDGRIVTAMGYPLSPQITIPPNAIQISISPDGIVVAILDDNTTTELGRITLVKFINSAGLKRIGDNLYIKTDASGDPIEANPGTQGLGILRQGFLEASNVDIVEEMINLITAQRAYEFNAKAIRAGDEMLKTAANLRP